MCKLEILLLINVPFFAIQCFWKFINYFSIFIYNAIKVEYILNYLGCNKQDILNQLNFYIVEEGSIEVCMIKYETKPATADVSLFFISILKINQ